MDGRRGYQHAPRPHQGSGTYLLGVSTKPSVIDLTADEFNLYLRDDGLPDVLVPLENPYALAAGAALRVRTLVDGRPVANQHVVYGGVADDGGAIAP